MKRVSSLSILTVLVGAACTQANRDIVEPATDVETIEAIDVPNRDAVIPLALRWLHNSAEYEAILRQTYRFATQLVGDMIENREPGAWAVALDADETVISNSDYEWELQTRQLDATVDNWRVWVAQQNAPALPGVIEFLQQVQQWGGRIAIVTNRYLEECPDTEANFRRQGIPYDVMLCRGSESEKEPRWEAVQNGTATSDLPPLEILLWVGDNIHDFPNLDQDLRFEGSEGYTLFGARYLMLPNPVHGSWKRNTPE
jgi:5'-nucleotidase (lipoprotein e(P4) family)